jgi:hypothetical protein
MYHNVLRSSRHIKNVSLCLTCLEGPRSISGGSDYYTWLRAVAAFTKLLSPCRFAERVSS